VAEIRILKAYEHKAWSDEKQALVPLRCAKCDRCKHAHARVFHVIADGKEMRVGLTCLMKLIEALPVNERRQSDVLAIVPKRRWSARDDEAMEFWDGELGEKPEPSIAARVGRGLRKLFGS
jgi:hypothetical protein